MTTARVPLLPPKVVAARLGVTTDELTAMRTTGLGPPWVKLSTGSIRYDVSDVADFVAAIWARES